MADLTVCPGLAERCGQPTLDDGRLVTETRLGIGTVVVGKLCPDCSADSRDLDYEAMLYRMGDQR